MTEGARRGFDSGNLAVFWMAAEYTAGAAKTIQFGYWKDPLVRQHRVKGEAAVALAQDAAVSLWPFGVLGVVSKHFVVQHTKNLH